MLGNEINNKILELKNFNKKIITNCYFNISNVNYDFYNSDKSLFFVNQDHGVNRIFYYTVDYDDLCRILKLLPPNHEYIIEFMTKNKYEYADMLNNSGFKMFAALMRLSNPDCRSIFEDNNSELYKFINAAPGKFAEEDEAEEINNKLWEIFDTRISHLLYTDELVKIIHDKEILISRNKNNEIEAILQTVTQPRKFYVNQVYNSGDKSIIHGMFLNKLKEYCHNGGKYLYAWVEEKNTASLKFHSKYGMKHDGTWNVVYINI